MNSILDSTKKLLGLTSEYTQFDTDIIIGINTALSILNQLGVGPSSGFSISNNFDEWTDFMDDDQRLELVKSYIHLKVKMLFDPPQSAALIAAMERQIAELENRIVFVSDLGTV